MQEYTILPRLGIDPQDFWQEVNDLADRHQAEPMLVYLHLLIKKMHQKKMPIKRQDLVQMGEKLCYYKGVESWFERINNYLNHKRGDRHAPHQDQPIKVRHYLISAGLKEIIEGCRIYPSFNRVYASEYFYDEQELPIFPKMLITDTSKTQFLFRINKGLELPRDNINKHMPEQQRPIPFSNIIYIGDGLTDVPSMAVVKQQGGHAMSIYDPQPLHNNNRKGLAVCQELLKAKRIDFYAEADFTPGSQLEKLTHLTLDYVSEKILFAQK